MDPVVLNLQYTIVQPVLFYSKQRQGFAEEIYLYIYIYLLKKQWAERTKEYYKLMKIWPDPEGFHGSKEEKKQSCDLLRVIWEEVSTGLYGFVSATLHENDRYTLTKKSCPWRWWVDHRRRRCRRHWRRCQKWISYKKHMEYLCKMKLEIHVRLHWAQAGASCIGCFGGSGRACGIGVDGPPVILGTVLAGFLSGLFWTTRQPGFAWTGVSGSGAGSGGASIAWICGLTVLLVRTIWKDEKERKSHRSDLRPPVWLEFATGTEFGFDCHKFCNLTL